MNRVNAHLSLQKAPSFVKELKQFHHLMCSSFGGFDVFLTINCRKKETPQGGFLVKGRENCEMCQELTEHHNFSHYYF